MQRRPEMTDEEAREIVARLIDEAVPVTLGERAPWPELPPDPPGLIARLRAWTARRFRQPKS